MDNSNRINPFSAHPQLPITTSPGQVSSPAFSAVEKIEELQPVPSISRSPSVPDLADIYQMPKFSQNPADQTPLHAICFMLKHNTENPQSQFELGMILDQMICHESECQDSIMLQTLFVCLGQTVEQLQFRGVYLNPDRQRVFLRLVSRLCREPQDSEAFAASLIGVCKCASLCQFSQEAKSHLCTALSRPSLLRHLSPAYEWVLHLIKCQGSDPLPANELLAFTIIEAHKNEEQFPRFSLDLPGLADCLLTLGELPPAKRLYLCNEVCIGLKFEISSQTRQRLASLLKEAALPPLGPMDPAAYRHQLVDTIVQFCNLAVEKKDALIPLTRDEIWGIHHLLVRLQRTYPEYSNQCAESILEALSELYERHSDVQLKPLEGEIASFMSLAVLHAQDADPLRWLWNDQPGGKILERIRNSPESERVSQTLLARLERVATQQQPVFARVSNALFLGGLLASLPSPLSNREVIMRAFQALAHDLAPDAHFEQIENTIHFLAQQCDLPALMQLDRTRGSACVSAFISGLGMLASKSLFRGFGQPQALQLNYLLSKLEPEYSADAIFWLSRLAEMRKLPPTLALNNVRDPRRQVHYWLESLLLKLIHYEWSPENTYQITEIILALGRMAACGCPLSLTLIGQDNLKVLLKSLMADNCPSFSFKEPFELLQAMGWFFNRRILPPISDPKFTEIYMTFILNIYRDLPYDHRDEHKMSVLFFLDSLHAHGDTWVTIIPQKSRELLVKFENLVRELRAQRHTYITGSQVTGNIRMGNTRLGKRKEPPQ